MIGNAQHGFVNVVDSMTVGDDLIAIRKPNLKNRAMDEKALDDDKNSIRFWAVFVAPLALIAFGILRWFWRGLTNRAPSHKKRAPVPPTAPVQPTEESTPEELS